MLPRVIPLPWGYNAKVQQLNDVAMDAVDNTADAQWDQDSLTIYIRRSCPMSRKCYLLTHEMVHVLVDWQHWAIDRGLAKP